MRRVFQEGFTLIEMIIAIILLALASISFTTFLVPQFASSADPHYQTRAVALGQSFMSQILSRQFDNNSDPNGGLIRCSETNSGIVSIGCTLEADFGNEESDVVANFNDVDDYVGCWHTPNTQADCLNATQQYPLTAAFVDGNADQYRNFRVEVSITYSNLNGDSIPVNKRIEMTIFPGNTQTMTLVAHRGNY